MIPLMFLPCPPARRPAHVHLRAAGILPIMSPVDAGRQAFLSRRGSPPQIFPFADVRLGPPETCCDVMRGGLADTGVGPLPYFVSGRSKAQGSEGDSSSCPRHRHRWLPDIPPQLIVEPEIMEAKDIHTLATLRAVVGYLGEKDQASWWPSTFFAAGSGAFLAPVFTRTQTLAQCTAVTRAAALVHDERIGVGHVYHLFRLPEDVEQRIHAALHEPELTTAIGEAVASRDSALDFLRGQAGSTESRSVGPTRVGDLQDLRRTDRWRAVAAEYLRGVGAGAEIYPYFADRT
jgi:hypothetical protein